MANKRNSRRWESPQAMVKGSSVINHSTGCWEWRKESNYNNKRVCVGAYYWAKQLKVSGAHQLAYIAFKGEYDRSLVIAHRCNVPNCVNPEHLYPATAKQNSRDMFYNRNNGLLNREDINLVIDLAKLEGATIASIMEATELNYGQISGILSGKRYSEISGITIPIEVLKKEGKLNDSQVLEIINAEDNIKMKVLAKRYGVSISLISRIRAGKRRRNVN